MSAEFRKVASLSDVPDGQMIGVDYDSEPVVISNVAGKLYAMAAICTHAEAYLDSGWLDTDTLEIECPLHEGRFDIRTGQPTTGPVYDPVKPYEVQVEGSDILIRPADE